MGQQPIISILIYEPLKQKRKDNSFVGNGNVGIIAVKKILENAGYKIGYCDPEMAHKSDIVLVSLTSTFDVFSLYQNVATLDNWKNRKFKVWAGGFGLQNPIAIKKYVDWAFFGRVDDWLIKTVQKLIDMDEAQHPSLMNLRKMNQVEFAQARGLISVDGYKEDFTGCPLKCKFCHYTFARKYKDDRETKGSYVQETLTGGGTPEVTWNQLLTWGKKAGRVRVAIDGFSERLRTLYGKGFITNDKIVEGIERMGSFGGITTLLIYNIGSFPYETEADRQELYETLRRAKPKHRVITVIFTTPFRPSLATPMQWEAANIDYDWSQHRAEVITDIPTHRSMHSFTLEAPYSHFMSVLAERMNDEHHDFFANIALSTKINKHKSADRVKLIRDIYDIGFVIDERPIDSPPPAPFLKSYVSNDMLRRIASRMRTAARG